MRIWTCSHMGKFPQNIWVRYQIYGKLSMLVNST